MFSFIFLILFLAVLFIFIIGGSIVRGILNLFFGRRTTFFGKHTTHQSHTQSQTHQQQTSSTNNTRQSSSKKRNKIFDDSEGEYVDFEEIHD